MVVGGIVGDDEDEDEEELEEEVIVVDEEVEFVVVVVVVVVDILGMMTDMGVAVASPAPRSSRLKMCSMVASVE